MQEGALTLERTYVLIECVPAGCWVRIDTISR